MDKSNVHPVFQNILESFYNKKKEDQPMNEELYCVARYFDDHFEGVVAKNLTKDEAQKLKNKYSNEYKNSCYTSFEIRGNSEFDN